MFQRPFRDHHLLNLLHAYDQNNRPLDLCISYYFREHKALGSKDRLAIADTIYAMVRWKALLDHLNEEPITWEKRLETFRQTNLDDLKNDPSVPLHIRLSFPQYLFELLNKSYGEEKASELCSISNQTAPATLRINSLKANRENLLAQWSTPYEVSPCQQAPNGVIFHKKIHFFSLPEFQQGFFEIQDEGSQLLSNLMQVKPGDQVFDYCAGSGGKTLAFAPEMKGKGQIFVHDIRPQALLEARKRLRRAGVQNAQIIQADDPKLKKLKKKMDWVLVDAPCSGTGTLRRNPDMKWNFNEEMLVRLVGQQRHIFEKALSFVKPGGHIVYATCSILSEENDQQIDHFIKTYDLELVGTPFRSFPSAGGMDGFFGAVFKAS